VSSFADPSADQDDSGGPTISVVMPTYNRLDRLPRALAALAEQTYPADRFEVVVVSDGATDGTNEWLRAQSFPFTLTPLFQENQGVAVARNQGVAQAQGDLILFIDDDVMGAPALVAQHVQSHQEAAAGWGDRVVVLGPMLPPSDAEFRRSPWVRWEEAMLDKQYRDMLAGRWQPSPRQFYTGNTSLPRKYILAAGGFDPSFRRAEDVELGYRLRDLGLRFVFNHQAIGYHYADRSFKSWSRTPYQYGRYDVVMHRDKGQAWLLPTVAQEYHGRHAVNRALVRLCLGRAGRKEAAVRLLSRLALLGDRLGLPAVPRYAYSGIFNLLYYQGLTDELGGPAAFWDLIREHKPDAV